MQTELTSATVAVNLYLMAGHVVQWFTAEVIAHRLRNGYSRDEILAKLEDMASEGDLLQVNRDGVISYSLATHPLHGLG